MNFNTSRHKIKSIVIFIYNRLRALVSDLEFTNKSQAYLIEQLEKKLEN